MDSILDTYNELLAIGTQIQGQSLTPAAITAIFRKQLKTADIKFKLRRDVRVDHNQIIVGGTYDPHEDEANYASITIYITFCPGQREVEISELDWPQLCIDVIECTGHELVHQMQYRSRQFDIGPTVFVSGADVVAERIEQEYLGSEDEIEAYGYTIAAEIYLRYQSRIINSLHIMQTAMYKAYAQAFGKQHSILRQLLLMVVKYHIQLTTNGGSACPKKQQ